MADERTRQAVKITDPNTDANEAAVDASGNLQVILASNTGVDIGDVDIASLPNEGQQTMANSISVAIASDQSALDVSGATVTVDLGANNDVTIDGSGVVSVDDTATHTAATTQALNIAAVAVPTDTAVEANDIAMPGMSLDRRLWTDTQIVGQDANLTVDLGATDNAVLDAIEVDTTNIDTNTTNIPNVIGTDGAAGPTSVLSVGGTETGGNIQELRVDADGHLQIDVLSGGSATTPVNPTIDTASSTATAAGSSANLDSAEVTEAEKLWEVHISASVAFKAQVQTVENGAATNWSNLLFGKAGDTIIWKTPHLDFTTHVGASAGVDVFRVVATNLDNTQAADLHAAFYYST